MFRGKTKLNFIQTFRGMVEKNNVLYIQHK